MYNIIYYNRFCPNLLAPEENTSSQRCRFDPIPRARGEHIIIINSSVARVFDSVSYRSGSNTYIMY